MNDFAPKLGVVLLPGETVPRTWNTRYGPGPASHGTAEFYRQRHLRQCLTQQLPRLRNLSLYGVCSRAADHGAAFNRGPEIQDRGNILSEVG